MKRIFVLLTCAAALHLGACSSDSAFPVATGKASIRAINAISTSEEVSFLIEERAIASAVYSLATSSARYDDLDYRFHFETFFAGDTAFRRIASRSIKFEANKDYTLLLSGTLANPTITLWEGDERAFDAADTVFEASFSHASASLGALDYYLADPAVTPALGNQVATLSFGEASPPADFAEGDFVLTITTAGDPNDVVYVSDTTSLVARTALIVTAFDGPVSNNAPIVVRAFNKLGSDIAMPDSNFPPSIEFFNGSMDLGTSDIYDDELLTSRRVADHAYLDVSAELDIALGANTFYYTPAGDTTAVSLEGTLTAFAGARYRVVATGVAGGFAANFVLPERNPVETQVKVAAIHTSNNFDFLDLYIVVADESIDEAFVARPGLSIGVPAATAGLATGSYDIYVTEFLEKVVLAGPYRIDVVLGDIVDMIIVDTVDPAVLDVLFLSGGPTP